MEDGRAYVPLSGRVQPSLFADSELARLSVVRFAIRARIPVLYENRHHLGTKGPRRSQYHDAPISRASTSAVHNAPDNDLLFTQPVKDQPRAYREPPIATVLTSAPFWVRQRIVGGSLHSLKNLLPDGSGDLRQLPERGPRPPDSHRRHWRRTTLFASVWECSRPARMSSAEDLIICRKAGSGSSLSK